MCNILFNETGSDVEEKGIRERNFQVIDFRMGLEYKMTKKFQRTERPTAR
jgi:hypothetical protein